MDIRSGAVRLRSWFDTLPALRMAHSCWEAQALEPYTMDSPTFFDPRTFVPREVSLLGRHCSAPPALFWDALCAFHTRPGM